jgi:hypothetical protein
VAHAVILATQEKEIQRIAVQSQSRQIVCETLSQKNPSQKRAGGVAQVVERLPSKREAEYCKQKPKHSTQPQGLASVSFITTFITCAMERPIVRN